MILLARCLLSKPSVVVLDEATSSLDNLSQQITTSYLSEIGTTKILIAHRLDTIKSADKILVMDNGEIVEILFACYRNGSIFAAVSWHM